MEEIIDKKPEWYDKNSGKGADDPKKIAKAVMVALRNNSPKSLYIYQDEQMVYEDNYYYSDHFVAEYNDTIDIGMDPKRIYLEGITYELLDEYQGNGKVNVKVKAVYYKEGKFGGKPIFMGNTAYIDITCHQNETPEGIKWFWGGYKPDITNDTSGLGISK
ncbi:MAG: hypothetical protein K5770_07130 [Lachnospiraceae bacterium]|nr:hypothetical protein [Lachnospiraceae bacterium]